MIENRFQNRDRKIFENFRKFRKNQDFSIFFIFFRKFSENFQLKSNFFRFSIFRFSENFRKFFRSKFQNRFSTKNFQYFSLNFFLNRYKIFPCCRIWSLEVARRPQRRVRWHRVRILSKVCILHYLDLFPSLEV